MKTSDKGVREIQASEGLRLQSYLCPAGKWTIGYGHTSDAGPPRVLPGMRINRAEAEQILRDDLRMFEAGVMALVKAPLTQGQFDALVSFAYNCGLGALKKSTLLKRVNAREFDKVPAEFMKWTRGGGRELPGLVRRRRAETALWRSLDDAPSSEPVRVVPDEPKPPKTMAQSKEGNAAVLSGAFATVAAVNDAVAQISTTGDSVDTVMKIVRSPNFPVMLGIIIAAGAIWYWRRRKLIDEGV